VFPPFFSFPLPHFSRVLLLDEPTSDAGNLSLSSSSAPLFSFLPLEGNEVVSKEEIKWESISSPFLLAVGHKLRLSSGEREIGEIRLLFFLPPPPPVLLSYFFARKYDKRVWRATSPFSPLSPSLLSVSQPQPCVSALGAESEKI